MLGPNVLLEQFTPELVGMPAFRAPQLRLSGAPLTPARPTARPSHRTWCEYPKEGRPKAALFAAGVLEIDPLGEVADGDSGRLGGHRAMGRRPRHPTQAGACPACWSSSPSCGRVRLRTVRSEESIWLSR